jgi:hypothetical protein
VAKEHNRHVRIRARALFGAMVLVLASAVAADALADLRSSATAMACCAKTNNQCAGLRAPDDCCKHMGHTSGPSAVGTLASSHPFVATAVTNIVSFIAAVRPVSASMPHGAFKRPHDPPHLHPFSLLI